MLGSRLLRLMPIAGSSAECRVWQQSTPKAATALHETVCAHCVRLAAVLMTFLAGSMSGRASSDGSSILVRARRCRSCGPPSTA